MTTWTDDELRQIGDAEELELSPTRDDSRLGPYTTMWVARVGPDLYVRSARGPNNPWYRRATASGSGHVRAGGIERDVIFADAAPTVHAAIDGAYHAKYDQYGPQVVGTVVGEHAHPVTIRLQPRRQ